MQRLTNTWWKKLGVGLFGFVVFCCVASVIIGALNPKPATTTASAPTSVAGVAAAAESDPTDVPADAAGTAAPEPTSIPTDIPAPTAEPTQVPLAKVGEQVDVEDVSWKVEEAIDAGDRIESGNQYVDPLTTAGKFIRVRVVVQNNGTEQRNLSASSAEITDSQGRTFKGASSMEAMMVAGDDSCGFQELPAGIPKTCHLIFEVPKEASGFKFKASNLALILIDTKEIDLGL